VIFEDFNVFIPFPPGAEKAEKAEKADFLTLVFIQSWGSRPQD
jgi:hypothetical protein